MDDSKFLITGANGQLGLALQARYPNARATDSNELDITDPKALEGFDWGNITTIINAAAYTDVDGAETPDGRVAAWKINAQGVADLVRVARQKDLVLVHISTDYVFDGSQNPHKEDEPLSPLSAYGASKAAGDTAINLAPKHYLLRSSWIIGEGKNFVRTMIDLSQKAINPRVVSDQVGRPTFAAELVRAIDHLLNSKAEFSTYNATNGGDPVSWADLAREIFKQPGLSGSVTSISTGEYFQDKPESAPRPLSSVFDLSKLEATGFKPRDWHEDLAEYVKKELSK